MTAQPLLLTLGMRTSREVLARLREGRRRALASVHTRVVVSSVEDGSMREHAFDQPPTVQDLLERVGRNAVVMSIEAQRAPLRDRPELFG